MRILIVNTYYYPEIVGGAEYSVKKLAEKLTKEGHDVRVLCTGKEYVKEIIDNVEVVRFKDGVVVKVDEAHKANAFVKLHRWIQELWCLANKKILEKELDSFKPDVIHTNGLYDISPIIWKLAKARNIRVVHTLRDYFLMCPRVSLTCARTSVTCKKPASICKIYRSINRKHSRFVDVVTAPSEIVLNTFKSNGFFKDSFHKAIPNATEYDKEEVQNIIETRRNKPSLAPKFVFLGSLIQVKGIEWLIESFRKLESPDIELYIAGKGVLEEYVKESVKSDSRIHYVGFLNQDEISSLLKKTDVLIAPSLWEEPFGRIVLDAYKHAMPVIVSNQGALPMLVDSGKTGIVADAAAKDSLRKAMNYFIENPETIAIYSKYCAKKLEQYSLDVQYQKFMEVYQ